MLRMLANRTDAMGGYASAPGTSGPPMQWERPRKSAIVSPRWLATEIS